MKHHSNPTAVTIVVIVLLFTAIIGCKKSSDPAPAGQIPVLSTSAVSAITQTSATCGGSVTSEGSASVTFRGVCWSTHPLPTIADSYSISGTATPTFSGKLNGLVDKATYYVRAYATNSFGTGYGDQLSFAAIVIGDTYQGGKVAYVLQAGDPGYQKTASHGLIAALADGPGSAWAAPSITGATGVALGTGNSNTTAIVNNQGGLKNCAAKYCADLDSGGYTDWYLPSSDELKLLMINQGAIGGIAYSSLSIFLYWSSTETNSNNAIAMASINFYGVPTDKATGCRVRAVRSF